MTPTYRENAIAGAEEIFKHLQDKLPWEQRGETPRLEVFYNESGLPYNYGTPPFDRTYVPHTVWDETVAQIKAQVEADFGVKFEACFLNCYNHKHHSLQWHADDSPSIDHTRPIVVVSFGAEREIWYKRPEEPHDKVVKLLLGSGSIFVMPAGMQQTHVHRIPKHDRDCGPRISLTFRGLV